MLKIDKIDDKSIRIRQGSIDIEIHAVFFAQVNDKTVSIIQKNRSVSYSDKITDTYVNGNLISQDPILAIKELHFVGSFSAGGSSPSPTPATSDDVENTSDIDGESVTNALNSLGEDVSNLDPNLLVVGGTKAFLSSTKDEKKWTSHNPGIGTNIIHGMATNGIVFVIVGNQFNTRYSEDLVSWREVNQSKFRAIRYVNGKFIALGAAKISYSDDGLTWTEVLIPGATGTFYSVVYKDGKYTMVNDAGGVSAGKIYQSTDLQNWGIIYGHEKSLLDIVIANDACIVCGRSGVILSSPDGVTWTQLESGTVKDLYTLAFNSGILVAAGTQVIVKSTDLVSFSVSDVAYNFRGSCVHEGYLMLAGYAGVVLKSSDGDNWKQIYSNSNTDLYACVSGNIIDGAIKDYIAGLKHNSFEGRNEKDCHPVESITGAVKMETNPQWYLDSVNGSDNNDGRTAATAKKTGDGLLKYLRSVLCVPENNTAPVLHLTINLADGSYDLSTFAQFGCETLGSSVSIMGNQTVPENVILTCKEIRGWEQISFRGVTLFTPNNASGNIYDCNVYIYNCVISTAYLMLNSRVGLLEKITFGQSGTGSIQYGYFESADNSSLTLSPTLFTLKKELKTKKLLYARNLGVLSISLNAAKVAVEGGTPSDYTGVFVTLDQGGFVKFSDKTPSVFFPNCTCSSNNPVYAVADNLNYPASTNPLIQNHNVALKRDEADAHPASAISIAPIAGITATDVQGALMALIPKRLIADILVGSWIQNGSYWEQSLSIAGVTVNTFPTVVVSKESDGYLQSKLYVDSIAGGLRFQTQSQPTGDLSATIVLQQTV